MTDKITSLGAVRAEKARDNRLWTPLECLQEAINDLQSGEIKANKLVIVFVQADDESHTISHYSANIKASEILSAAICMQARVLDEMGYP